MRDIYENNNAIQAINNNRIYIYKTFDKNKERVNKGWLKLGETKRFVEDRAKETNNTAGLEPEILFEVLAQDINGNMFSDHDIHKVLEKKGFQRGKNSNGNKDEWFRLPDSKNEDKLLVELIKVVENRINCTEDFEQLKFKPKEFKLRPNQQEAVDKTFGRWQMYQSNKEFSGEKYKKFLWNAKPRFGKTISAYEFAIKIKAKKILVLTHRTAISDSWHKDYIEFIKDKTKYKFGSSKENSTEIRIGNRTIYHNALSKSQSEVLAKNENSDLIFYISLADIKGKSKEGQNFKEKNKWIFQTNWDLVITDETHEATESDLAINVFDNLNSDFELHLSGTPYKKLKSRDYHEANTYTWSYPDEQRAKQNWSELDGEINPYAEMPKLNIFTYSLPLKLRKICESDEYAFDFQEFFRVEKGEFVHKEAIIKFLDNLSNQAENVEDTRENQFYPFADKDTRDQLKHTFWLLPMKNGIKKTEKLKELLNQHAYFRDYEIIMAAGDGDRDREKSQTALDEVKSKIKKGDKTITLSCGQLTTGVTVKEWTAVLMLNNLSSPEQYFQAAFRAQTPWKYKNENGKLEIKTDCFVFDFAPDRVLKLVDDYAELTVGGGKRDRKERIKEILNFLPVHALDETGRMKRLSAEEVLEMPRRQDASDVVDSQFMSNKLFKIGNIFNLPKNKKDKFKEIINKTEAVKNKKPKPKQKVDDDDFNVPDNISINDSGGAFGEKQYSVSVTNDLGEKTVHKYTESELNKEIEALIAKEEAGQDLTTEEQQIKDKIQEFKDTTKQKAKTAEEKTKDHLRGFTRHVPMLLLAYAKPDTRLDNIEEFVSHKAFEELTTLTIDDFKFLRDEADVFNAEVFNASVQEFLKRKKEFGRYFENENDKDIFEFIPPQENNQIFTPRSVVNVVLDILEKENPGIFRSEKTKFLDPQMKSGLFITEIVRRLYKNSKDKDILRILRTQVYGFAPSKVLTDITHEVIYGFVKNDDKLRKEQYNLQKNFVECDLLEDIKKEDGLKNNIIEKFGGNMKFDVIIGNPPYQEQIEGRSEQPPIYHKFMENAYKICDKVCFITPARFLFNAGKTPKAWNEKMLNDEHIKVEYFEQNSGKIFPGTDIKGGIAITYRDAKESFGKIGIFTHFDELNSIMQKVLPRMKASISELYYSNTAYKYTENFFNENEGFYDKVSGGSRRYLSSSVFEIFPEVFVDKPINNGRQYIKIIGLKNIKNKRERATLFFDRSYINPPNNFDKFKVILPASNGSGAIGEVLSTPLIGEPLIGYTETFISFGKFETKMEAENCLKYIKTKFARTMLGVRKITQGNKNAYVWGLVPLQDFTENSDINWRASIPEIDKQLYKKYGLSKEEIDFIEQKVKAME